MASPRRVVLALTPGSEARVGRRVDSPMISRACTANRTRCGSPRQSPPERSSGRKVLTVVASSVATAAAVMADIHRRTPPVA